ncbi:NAD(P)/FAD-dependent oxidoreductase [Vaginisenegalia massiliensis]|uniref:NAD(P)/FAD-dependent oxidoreductase n=1 Tax=Vaginisenegalia massiliensis TaxID=2058294 RepID=UPI001F155A12|nr:NAD(P)/FAD-dependent oxidoreductase [Vaginisenegalia massiliensis]
MDQYDVIVIGGGSSGLMAAINAAQEGVRTLLIEKNKKLGRKLLLSGGGRCNVTNRTSREALVQHIPGNGKFLYSALNQFDQEDIIRFFRDKGVALKEEDHGRMFPVTDKARTILETLEQTLNQLGVTILTDTPVDCLLFNKEGNPRVIGLKTKAGQTIYGKSIVLACGGRAYPKTGAEGDGYAWAKAAGHTIEPLYPTESPLLSNDKLISQKTLQGLSLQDVAVTVWDDKDKPIVTHQMDMIFTHFGYSGPAILRCSGHVNLYLRETGTDSCRLSLNLQPNLSQEALLEQAEGQRDKQILTILKQWMPERMAQAICQCVAIDESTPYKQLVHKQVQNLLTHIQAFPMTAYGSLPIEKGFVTGGGVSVKEVQPKTMESKLMPQLFFCGELLDINGYTGGYNITAAFVTGTVAGRHAAWASYSV